MAGCSKTFFISIIDVTAYGHPSAGPPADPAQPKPAEYGGYGSSYGRFRPKVFVKGFPL